MYHYQYHAPLCTVLESSESKIRLDCVILRAFAEDCVRIRRNTARVCVPILRVWMTQRRVSQRHTSIRVCPDGPRGSWRTRDVTRPMCE